MVRYILMTGYFGRSTCKILGLTAQEMQIIHDQFHDECDDGICEHILNDVLHIEAFKDANILKVLESIGNLGYNVSGVCALPIATLNESSVMSWTLCQN